ncbi:UDP-N-acetylmuramate:L-alanyl-gamma-D-glutamyl-me so-diaminopimelate ligase [Opitutales bacterium ASA1]|uniref:UDP-N-acetylmuramate--L-alanine ligase n=1 Tax=Congregicoccus parvus TaxID=3081749 RepID=UPI002B2F5340|nr:UDP-N-acetylmuramate:L-alanyl-gamma-D-glutamyl-me so-diaminopimelate ligase [Opitutales bacterium ASA1]
MGIAGTAMGNAALLLRAAGHDVSGADAGVYPPMSDVLAAAGIRFFDGYDADRLRTHAPDLVVVGNAQSRGNPEVEWLLESRAIPYRSLPAILHETILAHRRNIVVAGTHGKTTTTALTAYLLREAGADPGFLIGGVPQDPPTGTHLGAATAPFVIEGDEYDSAFFDKRSKFIHYAPHVAVLNNLEFDHADIFRDLEDVKRTFSHFLRIVPRNGFVVWNADDANLRALMPVPWTSAVSVGVGRDDVDVCIADFVEGPGGASFALRWRGREWARIAWAMPGLFNARNAAMAATAAALALYPESPYAFDLSALASFRGVRRRQDVRVGEGPCLVIEDFGHHPTAIRETLVSLRARWPGRRLIAAFEPRSNTARTCVLQAAFADALREADAVLLGPVSRADKLGEAERFDTVGVAKGLREAGRDALAAESSEAVFAALCAEAERDGAYAVVVFFSNGSFDGIIARFADFVRERAATGERVS